MTVATRMTESTSPALLRQEYSPPTSDLASTTGRNMMPAEERAAVVELTNYLGGYLSGKDVTIETIQGRDMFAANKEGKIILPDWSTYNLPVQGADKWTIYRTGLWHETQHVKYTPSDLYTYGSQGEGDQTGHWLVNVVEDRRIESMGVRWHRGALQPLIYDHAYCFSQRPDVAEMWAKAQTLPPDAKRQYEEMAMKEAYLQGVVVGKQKGKLPPDAQAKVDKAVNESVYRVEKLNDDILTKGKTQKQISDEVISVAENAKKTLGLEPNGVNPNNYEDTRTEEYSRNQQSQKGQTDQEQRKETKQGVEDYMDSKEDEAEKKEGKGKGKEKKQAKEKQKGEEGGDSGEGEEPEKEEKPQKGKGKGKSQDQEEQGEPEQSNGEGSEGEGDGEGEQETDDGEGTGEATQGDGKGPQGKQPKNNPLEMTKEDIEKARKTGGSEAQEEFKGIQAGKGFELPEGVNEMFQPVVNPQSTTEYADSKFRADMGIQLKDWKTGKKLQTRESGQKFDVRSYVSTQGKKSFTSMDRQSVKGQKYIYVLDFSGSQAEREKEYKRALINTVESLDGIGAKQAVFAFGYGDQGTGFYRIKTFEQGRWKKTDSGRIATMNAGGGTPTDEAYAGISQYVKRNRPDYVITVTDGSPDSKERTKRAVEELNRSTKMVAFGIAPSKKEIENYYVGHYKRDKRGNKIKLNEKQVTELVNQTHAEVKTRMDKDLQETSYRKHFVVEDVSQLPKKIVGLIAPAT